MLVVSCLLALATQSTGAMVMGLVTDSRTHAPIANAKVLPWMSPSGTDAQPLAPLTTDARGEFRLAIRSGDLPAQIGFNVQAQGYIERPARNWSPVMAGQEARVEIMLCRGATLAGRIVFQTAEGHTSAGKDVIVYEMTRPPTNPAPSECSVGPNDRIPLTVETANGGFEIDGLLPGATYTLLVERAGFESQLLENIAVGDGTTSLTRTLDMRSGTVVRGNLLPDGQAPIAGAFEKFKLVLRSREGKVRLCEAQTSPDGAFLCRGVSPGRYRVQASAYALTTYWTGEAALTVGNEPELTLSVTLKKKAGY